MSGQPSIFETFVSRDRSLVLAGLVAVSGLAWAYTIALSAHSVPAAAHGIAHANTHTWAAHDFAMTFLMWCVMMVAMMAPTAAPMLLALARISRGRSVQSGPLASVASFLLGYGLVWTGISAVATIAQWQLYRLALVSAAGASDHALFTGSLLLGAGLFQLSPLKQACLRHCRSPMFFLMTEWRPGNRGALRMGIHHGRYCVGCCWALMTLMFVAGTMNLLWAAGLMLLMLVEKALPAGRAIGLISGIGMIVLGGCIVGSHLMVD